MEKGLIVGFVGYLLIFIFATSIPVYVFLKARLVKEICALFSLILSVGLINLHGFVLSSLRSVSHPSLSEFYEVFWIIPPVVVYVSCVYVERKKEEKG